MIYMHLFINIIEPLVLSKQMNRNNIPLFVSNKFCITNQPKCKKETTSKFFYFFFFHKPRSRVTWLENKKYNVYHKH